MQSCNLLFPLFSDTTCNSWPSSQAEPQLLLLTGKGKGMRAPILQELLIIQLKITSHQSLLLCLNHESKNLAKLKSKSHRQESFPQFKVFGRIIPIPDLPEIREMIIRGLKTPVLSNRSHKIWFLVVLSHGGYQCSGTTHWFLSPAEFKVFFLDRMHNFGDFQLCGMRLELLRWSGRNRVMLPWDLSLQNRLKGVTFSLWVKEKLQESIILS